MSKISHVLNTSTGYLMGLTDNPNPPDDDKQCLNAINVKEKFDGGYPPNFASTGIGDGMLYFRHGDKEVSLPDNEFTRPLFIEIISKILKSVVMNDKI